MPLASGSLIFLGTAVLLLFPFVCTLPASDRPPSAADQTLLDFANRDRAAKGLPSLQWDSALAAAAHQHAVRMAEMNAISHQFPGELPIQDRARQAGARFSMIAENVAVGSSVAGIHTQWMNSPPHRANLLDPALNAVGISVVQSGSMLFVVEDFSTWVPTLTLSEQEQKVESQLAAHGLRIADSSDGARKACELDRPWAGQTPALLFRFQTSNLTHLPEEIEQRVASGKYHSASVGACQATGPSEFTQFRIAILLF